MRPTAVEELERLIEKFRDAQGCGCCAYGGGPTSSDEDALVERVRALELEAKVLELRLTEAVAS